MTTLDKSAERHLLVTIRSQPAHRQRVQGLLLELIEPVRREPGCLYYHLLVQAEDPTAFVLLAGWANEEAVAAHPTHPAVPGILALVRPLLASPWEVLPTQRVSENPT
ncbi:antibiotic biosynthesis monooxygenase [Hymenobacter tibetensis]|uniref:Antibiotic biosynthesis monooxygenase n=1 Tax=Hymenobacter tibetensis TaxID=497967 RepID=A0ABY4CT27_9BACT|nr:putative quinol monooxygenase [Hymenobacter tibetensis]UOG73413.1 antibiotic biosynthesis monooxygenase [Hymenobacter tibetensis]